MSIFPEKHNSEADFCVSVAISEHFAFLNGVFEISKDLIISVLWFLVAGLATDTEVRKSVTQKTLDIGKRMSIILSHERYDSFPSVGRSAFFFGLKAGASEGLQNHDPLVSELVLKKLNAVHEGISLRIH